MSDDFEVDFNEESDDNKKIFMKKNASEGVEVGKSVKPFADNGENLEKKAVEVPLENTFSSYYVILYKNTHEDLINTILKENLLCLSLKNLNCNESMISSLKSLEQAYFLFANVEKKLVKAIMKKIILTDEKSNQDELKIKFECKTKEEVKLSELLKDYRFREKDFKMFKYQINSNEAVEASFENDKKNVLDIFGMEIKELSEKDSEIFEEVRNAMKKKTKKRKRRKGHIRSSIRSKSCSSNSRKKGKEKGNHFFKKKRNPYEVLAENPYYYQMLNLPQMYYAPMNSMQKCQGDPHFYPIPGNSTAGSGYIPEGMRGGPLLLQNIHNYPIQMGSLPIIPIMNPNTSQSMNYQFGVGGDDSKRLPVNINNYNFIKNTNKTKKKKECSSSTSKSKSKSKSRSKSRKDSKNRKKYFDLKDLKQYKELESKLKKEEVTSGKNEVHAPDEIKKPSIEEITTDDPKNNPIIDPKAENNSVKSISNHSLSSIQTEKKVLHHKRKRYSYESHSKSHSSVSVSSHGESHKKSSQKHHYYTNKVSHAYSKERCDEAQESKYERLMHINEIDDSIKKQKDKKSSKISNFSEAPHKSKKSKFSEQPPVIASSQNVTTITNISHLPVLKEKPVEANLIQKVQGPVEPVCNISTETIAMEHQMKTPVEIKNEGKQHPAVQNEPQVQASIPVLIPTKSSEKSDNSSSLNHFSLYQVSVLNDNSNSLKIIDVSGKKKIILNRERKATDIKIVRK